MTGRRRTVRQVGGITQRPWGQVPRPYAPIRILGDDHVQAIHDTALHILARTGMRVLCPAARAAYSRAGADVVADMVRFDPGLVAERLASAPANFTIHARNPGRALRVGGADCIFTSVGGPAYVMSLDHGRRDGTFTEMCDFLRLVQALNVIQQEGGCPFEPLDLPASTRHLDICHAQIRHIDKSWQTQTLGRLRTMDGIEMAAIMLGISPVALIGKPVLMGVINTNSPLTLDQPMAEGLMTLAEYGQINIITPFTLAGAMAPVTVAGALVQQHAEALAGIVLTQIVRPGVPVVYGGFTSNVDMRSGAPAFGTPEYAQAAQIGGQLARLIGVPYRSSNVTAANAVDAQAAWESQFALWGALMGGAHVLEHGAGWMHGGLTASFEKLIIDAEMLQMMQAYFTPPDMTPDALAEDAIAEVGPGGHFFGNAHTMVRYEAAFHTPMVANWDNYPNWLEKGAVEAPVRANAVWKQLLAEASDPPLDPAVDEALAAFVIRRKAEGGAPMN